MSNVIFPELPGLKIEVDKSPRFSTKVQRAVSGKELRASFSSSPIWSFGLSYEFLRSDNAHRELQTLAGFFLSRRGSWDSFLYFDPDDHEITNEQIGIGDGVTRAFQLARTFGGFTEPVSNVASIAAGPNMWSGSDLPMWNGDDLPMWTDGVDYGADDYVLSSTGMLTFNAAPPPGVPIYWSGTYYYRCRFKEDEQGYSQFLHKLWQAKKVEFVGSLGTKI